MMKFSLTVISALFLCFFQAASKDIDSLLRQSVGGEEAVKKLLSTETLSQFGTINMNGLQGKFKQIIDLPDKYYLSVEFPSFSMEQVYDGTLGWQRTMNGQVSLLSTHEKDELIKGLYLSSYGYFFHENQSVKKAYQGEKPRNGELFEVVDLYLPGNDTVQVYFDKSTGFRKYIFSRHDVLTTITNESDYRDIEGIMFPFRVESDIQTANFSMVMKTDSISLNRKVEAALFNYPLTSEIDYHFPPLKTKVTIPLDYNNGHIRIQAAINGKKKVWMILDSGSATNILNLSTAEAMGLDQIGTLPGMGVGGIEDVSFNEN